MVRLVQGHKAARNFVATHILSRKVDVLATLPMSRPKALLSALLARQGREAPESRCVPRDGAAGLSLFRCGSRLDGLSRGASGPSAC